MTDEASFLAAIEAAPNDQQLPLVFADWLDDHGDPRGQWIRNHSLRQWMGPKFENPIPKLLESLAKEKKLSSVRYAASLIGEPIVPGLVELLKHETPHVRRQACMALRKIGKRAKAAVPALIEAIADIDLYVREQAAKALTDIGAQEATGTEQLKAALTDDNWSVRRAASKALGSMRAKGDVIQELIERFESPDAEDRKDVIEGLAQLGTKDVVAPLDRALDDPEVEVRVEAVQALGRLKQVGAATALCRAMEDREVEVRESAAEQFAGYSRNAPFTPEVVAGLTVLLTDKSIKVKIVATRGIERAGTLGASAASALIKNLAYKDADLRAASAQALGSIVPDDPTALAALILLVRDPKPGVAYCAIGALNRWKKLPSAVIDPLFDYIQAARAAASWEYNIGQAYDAFAKLESPTREVIDELREGLEPSADGRFDFSWQAAQALAALGPAAAPAIPELVAALQTNERSDGAVDALIAIGGTAIERLIEQMEANNAFRVRVLGMSWRLREKALPLVPALLRGLDSIADDWQRAQVFGAISSIGPKATEAIPYIFRALAEPQTQTAHYALSCLRSFGAALVPYLPQLIELSRNPEHANWRVTFADLFASLATETPGVQEPLRELLRDSLPATIKSNDWNDRWNKRNIRLTCMRGLLALKNVSILPDLVPLVTDPELDIRRDLVYLLNDFDTPAVLPLIRESLTDTEESVRLRAIEILLGRNDTSEETIAALVHAVEDRVPKVRWEAIDALNKLKVGTEPVLEVLTNATNDEDKKVAARAAIALKKLTPKEARSKPKEPKTKPAKEKKKPK
ncbi:MAG: HEAT repeat domain-containing protein [Planctomycetia bacterium]|nr:HEAT repeat domain-containing protein [Planctomycetia bacterium]